MDKDAIIAKLRSRTIHDSETLDALPELAIGAHGVGNERLAVQSDGEWFAAATRGSVELKHDHGATTLVLWLPGEGEQ